MWAIEQGMLLGQLGNGRVIYRHILNERVESVTCVGLLFVCVCVCACVCVCVYGVCVPRCLCVSACVHVPQCLCMPWCHVHACAVVYVRQATDYDIQVP